MEVWMVILDDIGILDVEDLCHVSRVCREWRRMVLALVRVRSSRVLDARILETLSELREIKGRVLVRESSGLHMISERLQGPLDLVYIEEPELVTSSQRSAVPKSKIQNVFIALSAFVGNFASKPKVRHSILPESRDAVLRVIRERVVRECEEERQSSPVQVLIIGVDRKVSERYEYKGGRGTLPECIIGLLGRDGSDEAAQFMREVPLRCLRIVYCGDYRFLPDLVKVCKTRPEIQEIRELVIIDKNFDIPEHRDNRYISPSDTLVPLNILTQAFPHLVSFSVKHSLVRFSATLHTPCPHLTTIKSLYIRMDTNFCSELQTCLHHYPSLTSIAILFVSKLEEPGDCPSIETIENVLVFIDDIKLQHQPGTHKEDAEPHKEDAEPSESDTKQDTEECDLVTSYLTWARTHYPHVTLIPYLL